MHLFEKCVTYWIFIAIIIITILVFKTDAVDDWDKVSSDGPEEVENVTSHPCSSDDSFRCASDAKSEAFQICVSRKEVCDGGIDCPDGLDETVEICGCLPTEFQCNVTSCIDLQYRCDNNIDCLDGKDEMDCETYSCPVSHIKCDNHVCVPRDKACNFVDDCGDNSDEKICLLRACFSTEFQCNNSQCVSMAYLCDNIQDCTDGSDEDRTQCDKHFKCPMGVYVADSVICDGWVDCFVTNMDELNCGSCDYNQYQCPNSQCINEANVCDGDCDCISCADEDNCETYACIKEEKYLCHPSEGTVGKCIGRDKVCDMINDCRNTQKGMDEYFCTNDNNCTNFRSSSDSAHIYCPEGRCLPVNLRCDGYADCIDGEDEAGCDIPICSGSEFTCSSGQCIPMTKRCDSNFDCKDRSDEADCASHICDASQTRCHSGQCIEKDKWCDFYRDCKDGSDERGCDRRTCMAGEFRCANGQCVDMESRCVRGREGERWGCEDSSHLFNCSGFNCGDMFKCRGEGYCIEMSRKCDRTIDCKFTNWDEHKCMYACPFESRICVCEKEEANCEGRELTSIPDFHDKEHLHTLRFSGNLLKLDKSSFSSSYFDKVTYLDLSNNSLSDINENLFESMWRLTLLSLKYNNISRLYANSFYGLSSLRTLHLHGNHITSLHNDTFLPLVNLRALDLSGQNLNRINTDFFKGLKRVSTLNLADNQIVLVPSGAFRGLHELLSLNLSNNRIQGLNFGVFFGLPSLETLDLSSNQIQVVASGVFNGLGKLDFLDLSMNLFRHLEDEVFLPMIHLEQLITDHHKFCCLASDNVRCLPEADEFSSCEDLMSNPILRISIWILGVVALLGNVVVILWRLRDFRGGRVHSFLITNLAIGDLLMGVYLLIIAGVDLQYRGSYIIHDEEWRHSDLCRFAGFVSTFSSELSVLTLTTITLDRLLCILFPLKRTRLGLKSAIVVMALIWLFVFLIAITPVFGLEYFEDFYGRSGVCLALHVTPDRPAGWEYSVAVFLVLNFASFLVIAFSYLWMFTVAKHTRNAVRTPESQNDKAMARRMTVIVMTDFCCWIPIILLGFVSLAGVRADNQVYAWIAVFVLPLNSATNPILYTLSTAPFLGNVRKRVTVFRKSFINSIAADTKHSYVEDRTTNYFYDRKSTYRQLELIRLRSLNNSSMIGCYSRDHFRDSSSTHDGLR